ncbi:METTL5 family protein [Methanocella arvoryzae]|uniref:Methyltransferase-like protein 5 n=1 Tax=Methanocella arvoryzae (strain DSM 22066 / NBRC 105507 / MRE50) TaxID=351160 RepID=Q0W8P3_METAR|nr:predicted N6 adenine-specific DNA methyltransferase [Methanocella arvoryzae MRE50]
MKKRKLEMLLEQVRGFDRPDVTKEQYATPAVVAADLLYFAFMNGDLDGSVIDLGCGTGILAIGARLLKDDAGMDSTQKVIGIDSDIRALEVAKANAESLGTDVDWVHCDVRDVNNIPEIAVVLNAGSRFDTVVMNPPFGAQEKGNDRPFLDKALEIGRVVYSIHNAGSASFIESYVEGRGAVTNVVELKFPMRHTYSFHKKELALIDVELYRIEAAVEKGENIVD